MKKQCSCSRASTFAFVLLAILLATARPASGEWSASGFEYETDGSTATVTRYFLISPNVTVPNTIGGLPVVAIGRNAFNGIHYIHSVTLPSSVRHIHVGAFFGCANLTNVTLSEGLQTIDYGAFESCTRLSNVIIPGTVTNIGMIAFSFCESLAEISLPSGITEVNNYTFVMCRSLTNVNFGTGVKSIGDYAFHSTGLNRASIPSGLTNIGRLAFGDCQQLTSFDVDASNAVYSSVEGVLFDFTRTKVIQYPIGRPAHTYIVPDHAVEIQDFAFAGCSGLTNVVFGSSLNVIGGWAFAGCSHLTEMRIPRGVDFIGESAFSACQELTGFVVDSDNQFFSSKDGVLFDKAQSTLIQYPIGNLAHEYSIPEPITHVGSHAFSHSQNLTNVAFSSNVVSIGDSAFGNCSNLRSIVLPESITSIGNYAFSDCVSLASVSLPEELLTIETGVFLRCSNLESIVLPAGLTTLGGWSFESCTRLPNFSIPGTVRSIGEHCFCNCHSLQNILLPRSVEMIGAGAFSWCTNLNSMFFEGNCPAVDEYPDFSIFDAYSSATVYYLAGTTGWGPDFSGRPTALWNPVIQTKAPDFGLRTNRFTFTISGVSNCVVTIEASTNLAAGSWVPIKTAPLTAGSLEFSDIVTSDGPGCFYRVRY